MARLSTPTRSTIGSPIELNRPRRILLQAQRATKHAIQTVQDSQHRPKDGREGGVHLTASVNPCILSALGNVHPKLSLFSLSLHNSKMGHNHPSIGYHKTKILDISFQESSHNTLEITRPRCARNPKGHLLPDELISTSRDGSCYRYVENRQGMLHATKPPTSKEGQAMGDHYQSSHIM
ncbi:hypothetical protein CRG98_021201 [Punica granatum]|uniref:Uncharacterized protein n=1 Tax=Punica granatum TaxID=22663 RepID=A0A2I0JRB2_PUNGR|nr:hypothetical protein CRG98_021201 [Punica granatum]